MGSNQQHDLWSISLGRWGSLNIRLHMVFLLFVVATLFWASRESSAGMMWLGVLCVAILTFSVLIHELGHFFASRLMDGRCDSIVLWPFGGVCHSDPWSSHRKGLAAALAGPLANLLVCLICLPVLALSIAEIDIWTLLHPFFPPYLAGNLGWVAILFWTNWVLFLVNLIPAHPFDGGQALYRLLAILWPKTPGNQLHPIVAWTGQIFAVGLIVIGPAAENAAQDPVISGAFPLWLPLSLLAVFVFFSARHFELRFDDTASEPKPEPEEPEEMELTPFPDEPEVDGDDELQPLEDEAPPLEDWIDERQESTREQREEIEADEEQRVDEILARLHETGMDGLSPQDREFLERISARYRNRQESQ